MTVPEIVRIASRSDFPRGRAQRVCPRRQARDGANSCLCDPNFADWPLNEAAVIESLDPMGGGPAQPDASGARLRRGDAPASATSHALADPVVPPRPRLRCRAQGVDVPVLLHARGGLTLRLLDPVRYQGRVSRVASDITQTNELIDVIFATLCRGIPRHGRRPVTGRCTGYNFRLGTSLRALGAARCAGGGAIWALGLVEFVSLSDSFLHRGST